MPWARRLAWGAGFVAVVIVAGEAACRAAGYAGLEAYRADRQLGWALKPNQATVTKVGHLPVRISAQGFRGAPFELPKSHETIRVFAVGNSVTFGWGVREDEIYHQVLARMLNDSARAAGETTRFEIVNAGVNAYNLWQAHQAMRRIANRYQPDGFLVAYTFNDLWNKVGALTAEEHERVLAGVRLKNALRRSALYNWLVEVQARWLYDRLRAWGAGGRAAAHTGGVIDDPAEIARFRSTLDSMIALTRDARLAISFTVLSGNGQGQQWPTQAVMARTGEKAGAPVLDLFPVLGVRPVDSLFLSDDGVHPSQRGHALIARLMYVRLCVAAAQSAAQATIYRGGCGSPATRAGGLSSTWQQR